MKNGKLCLAQLGVGYWGPNLLRNYSALPEAVVKSAADLSPDRREYVRKNFPNVEVLEDHQSIISDPEVDAIIIATPVKTHYELGMAALQAGKHVFVEKPLASSVAQAEELASVARQQGKVLMTGHTFVYHSAVHYLKDLIESGELGQVRYIYSQRLNLGRIRSDVDALWNFAPHDISIVQFLLGDPTPMSVARHGLDYMQRGVDDVVFVNMLYPNRVMVNIHVSWLDPHRTRRMTIVGSERMVVYDDTLEDKITIYDKGIDRFAVLGQNMDYDSTAAFEFALRSGKATTPKIDYVEPLKTEAQHFIDCIQNGAECLTGPHHALRVIKILEACSKNKEAGHETGSRKRLDSSVENVAASEPDQTQRALKIDARIKITSSADLSYVKST